LANFNPMLGSLCPLHRVAAFGAPDDRRIVIHLICVDTEQPPTNDLPPEVLKGFRRSPAVLGRLVLNLIASKRVDPNLKSNEISAEATEACDDILNFIFQEVFDSVEETMRKSRIQDLYGTTNNLGIVSPSEWPLQPQASDRKEIDASSPVPSVVSSSEESDEAESVTTSSGSDGEEG
jgi:hypothetical protein